MYLYVYNSKEQKKDERNKKERINSSDFSDRMVIKALRDFSGREKLGLTTEAFKRIAIRREEKGKPYFTMTKDSKEDKGDTEKEARWSVHYSVSHSGDWWGCLMAEEPVGFDLEVYRQVNNYEKISRRFFTQEEYAFILSTGLKGFFELWVRKEAYIKFIGTGLSEGLNSFAVIKDEEFSHQVSGKKKEDQERVISIIRSFEFEAGVQAAYCSSSGILIKEIISLNGEPGDHLNEIESKIYKNERPQI